MRSRASAPPTPPKPSASGSRPPTPGLGRRRPLPTPPLPPPPHQEGAGQGQGKGKGHQGALRQEGTEGPQVRAGTRRDRTPEATPHGGRKPPKNQEGAGTGTKTRRKRAPRQAPRPTPRKGTPRRGDQRRPSPTKHPNTHHRSKHRTPRGSHQRTPTGHRKPHGERRAHLHGENGPHPQRKLQGTPPHGAPPRPHRQATTSATTKATSQAPEEDEGTAAAPTTRDRNPQRTRDQGTGPQGGQHHGPSRDHAFGYEGRAALPSRFDAEYCYALGLTDGGLISAGLTSVRASVTNLLRPVEEWHCGGTPIPSMMNFERRKGK